MPAAAKYDDNATIKLTNHSRSNFLLVEPDAHNRQPESQALVWLGDVANTNELLRAHGVPRSDKCPAPEIVLTLAQWKRLGPAQTAFLLALAATQPPEISISTTLPTEALVLS